MNSIKIKNCIAEIVGLLSQEAYKEIAQKDFKQLLNAEDLRNSIIDYGGKVTLPTKENDFANYEFYSLEGEMDTLIIDFDLSIDGAQSDLTLVFYFRDDNGNLYSYSIYGIYVK